MLLLLLSVRLLLNISKRFNWSKRRLLLWLLLLKAIFRRRLTLGERLSLRIGILSVALNDTSGAGLSVFGRMLEEEWAAVAESEIIDTRLLCGCLSGFRWKRERPPTVAASVVGSRTDLLSRRRKRTEKVDVLERLRRRGREGLESDDRRVFTCKK